MIPHESYGSQGIAKVLLKPRVSPRIQHAVPSDFAVGSMLSVQRHAKQLPATSPSGPVIILLTTTYMLYRIIHRI